MAKRKLIRIAKRDTIRILWVWRFGFGWDFGFEDERPCGIERGMKHLRIWVGKYCVAIGHAFGL